MKEKLNKIALSSKVNHPRMRAFSYACSLPVTWQRWRTHHSIRRSKKLHATTKKLHANFMAVCFIEPELVTGEDCEKIDFRRLSLLWPWPWPDNPYIRNWRVFSGDTPTPDVQIS